MGSGHILVYAFDVLMQIYLSQGYTERDAVRSILENNLYGLDIDRRAAQLAYFAVMMKARQYDRRILTRGVLPHVMEIVEPGELPKDDDLWGRFGREKDVARKLYETFVDAKEYGSILKVDLTLEQLDDLQKKMVEIDEWADYGNLATQAIVGQLVWAMMPLLPQARILAQKYDATITNPPYAAVSGLSERVQEYVKKNYPDSKADLFAVFIERCGEMLKPNGFQAMITQHAWMFLSSFEGLRKKLMMRDTVNMAHLGARAFEEIGGEVVQTTSFVMRSGKEKGYKGTYYRLVEPTTQQGKEDLFLTGTNRHIAQQDNFAKIPGMPVAYWASTNFVNAFNYPKIEKYGISNGQNITGDNNTYIRLFWEVDYNKISPTYWAKCARGGGFRRYYGNDENVIRWTPEAKEHYHKDSIARVCF